MKKILILAAALVISGCDLSEKRDVLEGSWQLDCDLENNIVSGTKGTFDFDNGVFQADMSSCNSSGAVDSVSVAFPYTYGEYVILGEGVEARELEIHVDSNYIITLLVYEVDEQGENDKIYWTWGLNNTSVEFSAFGFTSNETESFWGGYIKELVGDEYYPITSVTNESENIKNSVRRTDDEDYTGNRPTTVNYGRYLEKK